MCTRCHRLPQFDILCHPDPPFRIPLWGTPSASENRPAPNPRISRCLLDSSTDKSQGDLSTESFPGDSSTEKSQVLKPVTSILREYNVILYMQRQEDLYGCVRHVYSNSLISQLGLVVILKQGRLTRTRLRKESSTGLGAYELHMTCFRH